MAAGDGRPAPSMRVLATSPEDRAVLADRLERSSHVVVVALCASWCTTCGDFRAACEAVARSRPSASLVWIDIEDDASFLGDVDIETFPTLAIFEGDTLRHYGAVLPQARLVERLVDDYASLAAADAPREIALLVRTLRTR